MLTLPLSLTSESFLAGGRGRGGQQINTSKLLEILCQLQLFDVYKDLQTLVTFFGRAKKFQRVPCACFHAWVADHVITFYDRVFALPRCQVPAYQAFSVNSFLTTEVTRNALTEL